MKVKPHLFSLHKNLDSLLAAITGFLLIQLFAKHSGIGVSPDSVTYLSSARHLLAGHGFNSFDNLPTSDFPFAYPFFLTIISWITRMDALQFGQVVNGLLFGLLLYVSGAIMNGFYRSSVWYKRILLSCILLSPALQEVYSFLWSETIFLLLILLFVISISNWLMNMTRKWFFISIGICAIACETRYAGVFLVLTGGILIFFNHQRPWRKRIVDSFLFGGLSLSLLLLNILRNYWLVGQALGIRPKNQTGFFQIMEYFGGVFCDWLLLERTTAWTITLACAVPMIFGISYRFMIRQTKIIYRFEPVIALTGLVYCAFMLISYSLTRYEQFTGRLLSPLFILLLWSLSWWIPGFLSGRLYRVKRAAGLAVLLVAAWFMNRQLAADWEYYDGVKDAGIPGYREDPFLQTDIVAWLKKNNSIFNSGNTVYSNAGDAFYFVTGKPARQLPFVDFPDRIRHYYNPPDKNSPGEYLVWFQNEENLQMPSLDSILKYKELGLVKQLEDGAIYETK